MEKNENELRCPCSIIKMQLDFAEEERCSDFWKILNEVLYFITPNVEVIDNDKK